MDEEKRSKIKLWLKQNWYIALAVLIVVPLLGDIRCGHTLLNDNQMGTTNSEILIITSGMQHSQKA